MEGPQQADDLAAVLRHLEPGEEFHAATKAGDAHLAVTNRRLIIASEDRVALRVDIDNVRRIQFDIERKRPATLVIVPEHPSDQPQVLAIETEELERAARTMAIIGKRLAEVEP